MSINVCTKSIGFCSIMLALHIAACTDRDILRADEPAKDGTIWLNCGTSYDNIGTTQQRHGASASAMFRDNDADTLLATVYLLYNQVLLDDTYKSGTLASFVDDPGQNPNSIKWTVINLNPRPFIITDTPLQRIELPPTLKAGDSLSLSGFSLNYTAATTIPSIKVIISYAIGYSSSYMKDTSTAAIPASIVKTLPNTGVLTFSAADLSGLRRGYYYVSLQYQDLSEYNGFDRKILLGKLYSTTIPFVIL